MSNLKFKAAKGVFWSGLSSVTTGIIQAILLVIFARYVQPSEYGLISLTMVLLGFVLSYSDLGISGIIIQTETINRKQLSTFFYLSFTLGIVLFILSELLAPYLTFFFENEAILPAFRICSVLLVFTFSGRISESILQRELQFKKLAIVDILSSFISLAIAVLMIIKQYGMWAIVGSLVTSCIMRTILLITLSLNLFRPALHFDWKDISKHYIHFSLFQFGERTVNYFLERFDQFLIGKLGTASMLGSYSIAFNTVVQSLNRINPILLKVAFPVFTKIQNDALKLKKSFFLTIRILSIVNTAILIGFLTISNTAIPLLFSNKWNESIPIFQVLSMVVLLRCIGNPSGALILSKGKANIGFYWNLIFLLISIPSLIIGFLWGKALGVALALLVLQLVLIYPFYSYCVKSILGSCFLGYMKAAFVPILSGSIASLLLYRFLNAHSVFQMTLKLLLFESIFFCFVLLFNKNDWVYIKELILNPFKSVKIKQKMILNEQLENTADIQKQDRNEKVER